MTITTSIETITPVLAKEWLGYNTNNRPLNRKLVQQYADAMTRGEWVLNGDSIRFSVTGRLLDSQHRLHAVLLSGVTIQSLVVYGLPDEVFETIDCGRRRGVADVLHINGYKNRNVLGAVLMQLFFHINRSTKGIKSTGHIRPTSQQLMAILEDNLSVEKSIATICAVQVNTQLISKSLCSFVHYLLASKGYESEATEFFMHLYKGYNLQDKSPVLTLRNFFINKRSMGGIKFDQTMTVALIIKAWNKHIAGEKMSRISYDAVNEDFPQIYAPKRKKGEHQDEVVVDTSLMSRLSANIAPTLQQQIN